MPLARCRMRMGRASRLPRSGPATPRDRNVAPAKQPMSMAMLVSDLSGRRLQRRPWLDKLINHIIISTILLLIPFMGLKVTTTGPTIMTKMCFHTGFNLVMTMHFVTGWPYKEIREVMSTMHMQPEGQQKEFAATGLLGARILREPTAVAELAATGVSLTMSSTMLATMIVKRVMMFVTLLAAAM